MSAESYLSRGVSPTKDDVKAAVKNQSKGVFPGAFCKLIEDLAGDPEYCTAIHADGAGTMKSISKYDSYSFLAKVSTIVDFPTRRAPSTSNAVLPSDSCFHFSNWE